ncbi:MAG: hypothetical protein AB7K71_21150 [Polyangiaceae bacterium]
MSGQEHASVDLDTVENTRFIGPEFLVWLWFKSELFGSELDVEGFGTIEVWLDTQLVLESQIDSGERTTLKGMAPSGSPEALTAMKQGKMPIRARIQLNHGKLNFSFTFDAVSFAISNLKIPAVVEEGDEVFYERMLLVEQLDQIIGALYTEYLTLRVSPLWEGELAPAMRDWVQGETELTVRAYNGMLKRAGA